MRLVLFAANFQTFNQQTTTESDGNVGIKVSFHHRFRTLKALLSGEDGHERHGAPWRVEQEKILKILKVSNTAGFGDLHDVDAEFEKVYR